MRMMTNLENKQDLAGMKINWKPLNLNYAK